MFRTSARIQLRKALRKREMSQARLAAELHVSQNSVSVWLRGIARPEPHRRPEIERILGVPAGAWLLDTERSTRPAQAA